ncbi:MAG: hypothetical protein PHE87_08515, partial [Victivallaceae bacterium]|nr:hypothetical protein [Victivallaceae bacterium]
MINRGRISNHLLYKIGIIILLVLFLLAMLFWGLSSGASKLSYQQIIRALMTQDGVEYQIIWNIR